MRKLEWVKLVIVTAVVLGTILSFTSNSFAGDDDQKKKAKFFAQAAVAKDAAEKGGFMGIYPSEISDEDREALDFKGNGILVEDVVEDGPSETAGLKAGDIITVLDGKKLKTMKDLRKVLSKHEATDKIKVEVIRDGKKEKFKVELAERPVSTFASSEIKKTVTFLGVETQELGEQLSEYFNVSSGVLITKIVEESSAEKAGLKAGDVIISIAGHEIEDTGDLGEIIRDKKPDQEVKIAIKREGMDKEITAKLGEKTYTSRSFGIGDNTFDFDFDFDDKQIRIDHESIEKIIQKALHKADLELSEEDAEEVREEMEKVREEIEVLRKELKKMKNELKDELKKSKK